MQLRDRDRLEPQPREGGRGKGKPSQLEDWKSLKPKPPQPRGLVGFNSILMETYGRERKETCHLELEARFFSKDNFFDRKCDEMGPFNPFDRISIV